MGGAAVGACGSRVVQLPAMTSLCNSFRVACTARAGVGFYTIGRTGGRRSHLGTVAELMDRLSFRR